MLQTVQPKTGQVSRKRYFDMARLVVARGPALDGLDLLRDLGAVFRFGFHGQILLEIAPRGGPALELHIEGAAMFIPWPVSGAPDHEIQHRHRTIGIERVPVCQVQVLQHAHDDLFFANSPQQRGVHHPRARLSKELERGNDTALVERIEQEPLRRLDEIAPSSGHELKSPFKLLPVRESTGPLPWLSSFAFQFQSKS